METSSPADGRKLLWYGILIAIAGPILFAIQLTTQRLETPWYIPIFGTLGAAFAILSFLRRGTAVRIIVALVLAASAIIAWTFLTTKAALPPYSGPVTVGQSFPAFSTKLADGTPFDQTQLPGEQTTVLTFFRGQWCPICMIELRRLDDRHKDFAAKNIRVYAVSMDEADDANKSQAAFKHLKIVADTDRKLITAAGVLHEGAHPSGGDTAVPTTVIIDRAGVVRRILRSDGVFQRFTPDEVLAAVDRDVK